MRTVITAETPASERALAYKIAAEAEVDPRTALRALREGPAVVRTQSVRTRIAAALALLAVPPVTT